MQPRHWTSLSRLAAGGVALAFALGLLAPLAGLAQGQPPGPPSPPAANAAPSSPSPSSAPAATAPYKAVAITLPEPLKDPSFVAFRAELVRIAERRDRAALGRLVAAKGFFWERESGDGADSSKSGLANFAAAIGLDDAEDPEAGWDAISIYAEDATVFALSDRPGVVCGPADPNFDEEAFQLLLDATRTDVSDWVYPVTAGVGLRAAPRADAPVAENVGLAFIRVLDSDAPSSAEAAEFIHVVLGSGKVGFVALSDIASLGVSQLCYRKDGDAWKIIGVLGGVE